MKIIHTSDWHLGKRLHQVDLTEDQRQFTEWFLGTVKEEQADVVLISGDVFDLANPSSEARKLYYESLVELSRLNCTTIITGGNHDSPSVLNAPKEVLRALNIHVIGGLPEKIKDVMIPVQGREDDEKAVIAAIPFLRDADLRNASSGESYEGRREAVRAGITQVFDEAAKICQRDYPNMPAIAMGHLFAQGVNLSDSERDVQVGNQAQYDASNFNSYFRYIALGHIHKPQKADRSGKVLYSGSPLPLSFSEIAGHKRIIVYEVSDNDITHRSIDIPAIRQLRKITGTLEEIRLELEQISREESQLPILIEIEMDEEKEDPQKITDLEALIDEFNSPHAQVVKHRVNFRNVISGTGQLYDPSQQIEDLKPKDVFEKKLERSELDECQKELLREAFNEILQQIEQTE